MKLSKIIILIISVIAFNSCASGYKIINPSGLSYNSLDLDKEVSLSYKYDLLNKKYSKKETKRGVKLVAIKITNNSDTDLVFGQDIVLTYENGNEINIMDSTKTFSSLKQSTATYLLYLLLSPMQFTKTETVNGITTRENIFPVGLIVGPGIAGGNMLQASSANKKLKRELLENNLVGMLIKKGETKSGLIGIKSDSYDAIKVKVKN